MASIEQIKNSAVVTKTTLVVDSIFRSSGDINNFTFDLGTTITEVKLIEITSVAFLNILNNVDTTNNVINWVDNLGVTHFNTITPGNYTLESLFVEIQDVLTNNSTLSTQYTAQFNFNTNRTTISNTTGVTFDLLFGTSSDLSIGEALGYGTTSIYGVTSATSDFTLEVIPTKKIYVGSTKIVTNAPDTIIASNGVSNTCVVFDVNNVFGNIILDRGIRSIKNDIPAITSLDFTLRQDDGTLLTIPAETNESHTGVFSITLDIYAGIFDLTYYD